MATELRWDDPVTPENDHITIRRGTEDDGATPETPTPEPESAARVRVTSPAQVPGASETEPATEATDPPADETEAAPDETPAKPAKKDKATK